MKSTKNKKQSKNSRRSDFFVEFWEESWTYIKTVVDVLREPVLILDKDLKVLAANEAFYDLFHVKPSDTENKSVYDLGNGQWDIPSLHELLEDTLHKDKFFKGFEVEHEFPTIGKKIIILNARHIYSKNPNSSGLFPPLIMLAMEDVTGIMGIANTLANHTNQLEKSLAGRTSRLEEQIAILEKQIRYQQE